MKSTNWRPLQTYPLDTSKTRAQNRLLGSPVKEAASSAAKAASKAGRWRGVEALILRTAIGGAIQMTGFEYAKVLIDGSKFSDGSTTLEGIKREKGRDEKIV